MKLSEKMTMRSNNLSFLKFIASLLVIYSHSYAVSVLNTQGDIFYRLGGSKLSLGAFAVGVFFFFSGFYICRSVEKAKNANRFFSARIRRIFPALIFVILLTVFVLGPIVTSLNIVEYLTNKKTYLYLLNIVLIPVHKLPGVFESNVYNLAVNGSLWTLPFEFLCYFGTFIIYKMKCLNAKFLNKLFIPVLIIFLLTNYFQIPIFNYFKGHYRAVYMYYFGMLFYVNRNNIMLDKKIYIISSLLFVFFG